MTTRLAHLWQMPRRLVFGAIGHLLGGCTLLGILAYAVYRPLGADPNATALAMIVYAVIAIEMMFFLPLHRPNARFGWANRLTLFRGVAVAFLAGFTGQTAAVAEHGWVLFAIALVALIVDGFDGYVARRSGLSSEFGARFDMETDTLMILVLAALACTTGKIGAWIILAGMARYLFVAAGYLVPALRRPLPASSRRKAICVIQCVALFLILIPFLPASAATAIGIFAVGTLAMSFGIDIYWLIKISGVRASGKGSTR